MSAIVTLSRPVPFAAFCSHRKLCPTFGRERLSKTWTSASVLVKRRWAQLEPMKPAPPKINTDRDGTGLFIETLLAAQKRTAHAGYELTPPTLEPRDP